MRIKKRTQFNMYSLLIFIYVISAIAFESTPETSIISTIAIYMIFGVGVITVLNMRKVKVDIYIISKILFCLYAYIMTLTTNASQIKGAEIVYLLLTCSVLCMLIYWGIIYYYEIIEIVIAANIVGALVLVLRIINAYDGVSNIIKKISFGGEQRIGSLINNANAIGLFLAGAILSCIYFLFSKNKSKIFKIIIASSILILGIMLLLTGSRKSFIFATAGIVFFLLLYYKKTNIVNKIFVYILLIFGIIVIINIMRTVPIFSSIYERFELLFKGFFGNEVVYETDQMRKYMISEGINQFLNHPFFGNGTGRSYVIFGTYSHNNFVELLMNYGIVGFSLFYIPLIILLFRLGKLAYNQDVGAIYFFISIFLQFILGIGWVNYYERMPQLMCAVAWGYLYYNKIKEKKRKLKIRKKEEHNKYI